MFEPHVCLKCMNGNNESVRTYLRVQCLSLFLFILSKRMKIIQTHKSLLQSGDACMSVVK